MLQIINLLTKSHSPISSSANTLRLCNYETTERTESGKLSSPRQHTSADTKRLGVAFCSSILIGLWVPRACSKSINDMYIIQLLFVLVCSRLRSTAASKEAMQAASGRPAQFHRTYIAVIVLALSARLASRGITGVK